MARPSKLSPEQWAQIQARLATDGASKLGREFGVSEAAIRKKFGSNISVGSQSAKVREAAQMLAEGQKAVAALPASMQPVAIDLAAKLRNISTSLASAAELGAATAHRLHALANSEVAKVDDASPMDSLENLRNVGVLTKLANDSAVIARDLLSARKSDAKEADESDRLSLDPTQRAARVAHLMEKAARRKALAAGQAESGD